MNRRLMSWLMTPLLELGLIRSISCIRSTRAQQHRVRRLPRRRRILRQPRSYLALCRSVLAKRLTGAPFGDPELSLGINHVSRAKLRAHDPGRRFNQDQLVERQIRNEPTQPDDFSLQFNQLLGLIGLQATISVSPPIIGHFSDADLSDAV